MPELSATPVDYITPSWSESVSLKRDKSVPSLLTRGANTTTASPTRGPSTFNPNSTYRQKLRASISTHTPILLYRIRSQFVAPSKKNPRYPGQRNAAPYHHQTRSNRRRYPSYTSNKTGYIVISQYPASTFCSTSPTFHIVYILILNILIGRASKDKAFIWRRSLNVLDRVFVIFQMAAFNGPRRDFSRPPQWAFCQRDAQHELVGANVTNITRQSIVTEKNMQESSSTHFSLFYPHFLDRRGVVSTELGKNPGEEHFHWSL